MTMHVVETTEIASPLGPLRLAASEAALVELHMLHIADAPYEGELPRSTAPRSMILRDAIVQLDEYFAGTRRAFELPLALAGTDFQQRVWQALRTIEYGVTWSYGRLAATIGEPKASRAVGAANGRNPISIVVPCHRVIGANGSLIGFGGGMRNKRWLLAHEAKIAGHAPLSLF